ncbi:MAG: response regulator [Eubacteriales bacterium]|nr:response regulator [Eubacteriales bacterium]
MKILIVDDEAPIKDYIAHCIRQSGADCEIVGSAPSGAAALRLLEQQAVDLVLTDITMPRMDGLELLEQIHARWPQIDVVMLTCHDDFSFARSAMQQGAADYILKSEIEPDTMRALLERVAEKRLREHPEQIVTRRLSFGRYLAGVLADPSVDLLDREEVRTYLLGYELGDYFVCVFRYNKAVLDELALARFPWIRRQWTLPLDDGGIFVLADLARGMGSGEQQRYLAEFAARLSVWDEQIGMSAVYHDVAALKRAAADARRDLSRSFYRGAGERSNSAYDSETAPEQLFVFRNNAITALIGRDWAGFREQMDALFDFARERQVPAERLKRLLCFIVEMAADTEQQSTVLLAQVADAAHLEQLRGLFEAFTEVLEQSGRQYSENIESALAYIRRHFRAGITLQDAAGAAFLNTEYFSRRFKKEVGVNFSEYLLTLRMQEAQRLLRTTTLRVSEIAEQVGIPNVSYFTSVYKKQFSCTPAESRKR